MLGTHSAQNGSSGSPKSHQALDFHVAFQLRTLPLGMEPGTFCMPTRSYHPCPRCGRRAGQGCGHICNTGINTVSFLQTYPNASLGHTQPGSPFAGMERFKHSKGLPRFITGGAGEGMSHQGSSSTHLLAAGSYSQSRPDGLPEWAAILPVVRAGTASRRV